MSNESPITPSKTTEPNTIAERHRLAYLKSEKRKNKNNAYKEPMGIWEKVKGLPLWGKIFSIAIALSGISGFIQFFEYLYKGISFISIRPTPIIAYTPAPTLVPMAITPFPTSLVVSTPVFESTTSSATSIVSDIISMLILLALIIAGIVWFATESNNKRREEERLKREQKYKEKAKVQLVKAISISLKKHRIVCEFCLEHWKDELDLVKELKKYVSLKSNKVEYDESLSKEVKEHILKIHPSYKSVARDLEHLPHIKRDLSWIEKIFL